MNELVGGISRPINFKMVKSKMLELDLLAAKQLYWQQGRLNLSYQQCFEEIQSQLLNYTTRLSMGEFGMPEDGMVCIQVNKHVIARFQVS